ncbi:apolipoprotein N-acyltransferase [Nocardiopsis kunsanensis]|uniref:Apolipoprotein N-acyltransferase n=1 Tax=Nocardiopsis kunsanensis TaxID=141693 RepID=A0A918X9X6_9ACTN|nr:apolipoprotein N-acyltransferase [Nocardiopsis kunsanensis]GHD20281.1 apolipoprotein N-acyltransferase [Nocardiopsis kunsanensis]
MVAEQTGSDSDRETERAAGPPRPTSGTFFPRGHHWGRYDLLWRVAAALGSGASQLLALPPYGLWWFGPLSAALLFFAVAGARPRRAAWLGVLAGAALMVPLVRWQDIFGADVWLAIAGAETVYFVPMAIGLALVGRLPGWPAWTAALWVAQEAVRARWPLGGFPWGKLAFAQPDTAFTGYAALGSSALVSFAVALTGALLLWTLLRTVAARGRTRLVVGGTGLITTAAIVTGGVLAPAVGRPAADEQVTVGMVQGDVPNVGEMSVLGERMQVLQNHAAGVHRLADEVRDGSVPRPDMVLLPENASDIDPFRDPAAREIIDGAAADIGVPLLWGLSRFNDDGTRYVQSVVWDPEDGPGEHYDKRYLVPFGEYVPYRDFFTRFIERLGQVSSDALPGRDPGDLDVAGTTLAVGICFDVAFDRPVREAVDAGGQIIVVPTNNANYNFTGQSDQQLAITQLRAVEHGRPAVVTSTSGISAVVEPDGTATYRSPEAEPDIHVAEVTAMDGPTVATRIGAGPEWALTGLGLAAVAGAVVLTRRRDRAAAADRTGPVPAPPHG